MTTTPTSASQPKLDIEAERKAWRAHFIHMEGEAPTEYTESKQFPIWLAARGYPASQPSPAPTVSQCEWCGHSQPVPPTQMVTTPEELIEIARNIVITEADAQAQMNRLGVFGQPSPALDLTDYSTRIVQTNTAAIAGQPSPARSDKDAARRQLEELLGQYWDIAHREGRSNHSGGTAANAVLSKIRALFAASTYSRRGAQESEDAGLRADEAARLRRVVNLLGIGSQVPEDDATLRDCLFAVLGQVARKIEAESAPSSETIDTWQKRGKLAREHGFAAGDERPFMREEIAELRAALASRATATMPESAPSGETIDTPEFRELVEAHVRHAVNGGMHRDKPEIWNSLVAHIDARRATTGTTAPALDALYVLRDYAEDKNNAELHNIVTAAIRASHTATAAPTCSGCDPAEGFCRACRAAEQRATPAATESVGCVKCPRDPNKRCGYCGYDLASNAAPDCQHRRQATTALGALTGAGWKCKDCGKLISEAAAPDQVASNAATAAPGDLPPLPGVVGEGRAETKVVISKGDLTLMLEKYGRACIASNAGAAPQVFVMRGRQMGRTHALAQQIIDAMTDEAKARTSYGNIRDVLDAVRKLNRTPSNNSPVGAAKEKE